MAHDPRQSDLPNHPRNVPINTLVRAGETTRVGEISILYPPKTGSIGPVKRNPTEK